MIKRYLHRLAWPTYPCERCVGQVEWSGCHCDFHGAIAPGVPPGWWRIHLRKLLDRLA